MKLVDVYSQGAAAVEFLFELIQQTTPEQSISHRTMPGLTEHATFVASHPYRYWFLIVNDDGLWLGAIYATWLNEIGIRIDQSYQGGGYGPRAVQVLIDDYIPLPEMKAVRRGHWLANIAPGNERSKLMFQSLGFREIQRTYAYDRSTD